MDKLIKISVIAILFLPVVITAQSHGEIFSAFQKYLDVEEISISTPTIVELKLSPSMTRGQLAVYNITDKQFEPHIINYQTISKKVRPVSVTATHDNNTFEILEYIANDAHKIIDGDYASYEEFGFLNNTEDQVYLDFIFDEEVTSSGFSLDLDNHVALPQSVEVRAVVDGEIQTIVDWKHLTSKELRFPKTFSKEWRVSFAYSQPLRITELDLLRFEKSEVERDSAIRFLAQPENQYRIYFDADRSVSIPVGEKPQLGGDQFMVVDEYSIIDNPGFVIADVDGDGVPDINDNCVRTANSDQADVNNNGRGDVCDDFDFDGVINLNDNCVNDPNGGQADEDGDGIGDVCDGEESRLTERSPWVAWAGITAVAIVLIGLIALVLRDQKKSMAIEKEEAVVSDPPIEPEDSLEEVNSQEKE